MLRDPDQLLLLLGVALAIALGIVYVRQQPLAGIALLIAVHLLTASGISSALRFGSYSVYLLDLVFIILAGVVLTTRRPAGNGRGPLLALIALAALAALRGILEFGLEEGGHATRALAALLVPVAFGFWTLREVRWGSIERLWRWSGTVLVIVAVVFLVRNGLGTYGATGERSLNSPQAIAVATAAVLALTLGATRRSRWFAIVALAVVLTSQQRTVWAAVLIGLASFMRASQRSRGHTPRRNVQMLLGFGLISVIALLTAAPEGLRSSLTESTSTISTTSGTFGWRFNGWIDLLQTFATSDLTSQLIGQSAGSGFARTVFDRQVTVSPHNMYLTILISFGAFGLAALLMIYAQALRHTRSSALRPLVWIVIVYSIGYQIDPSLALVLGVALSAAPQKESSGQDRSDMTETISP